MYTGTCVVLLREVPQKIKHSAPLVVQEQSAFRFLRALDDLLHALETIAREHIQQKENTHHARLAHLLYHNKIKAKLRSEEDIIQVDHVVHVHAFIHFCIARTMCLHTQVHLVIIVL